VLNGPRLISLHPCCSVSINPPTAPAQPETLPLTPPTSQEPWGGGAANAGIAMATIIAAKISASTHTIRARRKVTFMFLSLVLSSIAFRHRVCTRMVCNRMPPSFRLCIVAHVLPWAQRRGRPFPSRYLRCLESAYLLKGKGRFALSSSNGPDARCRLQADSHGSMALHRFCLVLEGCLSESGGWCG